MAARCCCCSLIPIVWSLPTSLMVGELASAIPEEGGFYVWVRRAPGQLLGLPGSLALAHRQRLRYGASTPSPSCSTWAASHLRGLQAIAARCGPSCRGAGLRRCGTCAVRRSVGGQARCGCLRGAMLSPFVALIAFGLWRGFALHPAARRPRTRSPAAPVDAPDMAAAISVCMWNYMGWDNASTDCTGSGQTRSGPIPARC